MSSSLSVVPNNKWDRTVMVVGVAAARHGHNIVYGGGNILLVIYACCSESISIPWPLADRLVQAVAKNRAGVKEKT